MTLMCSQILKTDKELTFSHVFLLLPLLLLSTPAIAQPMYTFCDSGTGNYTSNSSFENNLKHLLQSLPSNTYLTGFNITSMGIDANRVSGRALCRGDVTDKVCWICLENASREIMKECKSQEAIIWYELCQVHYSYRILSGMDAYTGKYPLWNNQEKNVSDPLSFYEVLNDLMRNLTIKAAQGPFKLMFGTDQVKFSRSDTIYGLVQCTRDLTVNSCRECLSSALGDLKACCHGRGGGTIFSRSCNMRYGLTRFYDTPSVKGKFIQSGVIYFMPDLGRQKPT